MKQIKVVIVGNGDRANCYCKYALSHPEDLKVVAIVDPDKRKQKEGAEKYGVSEELCFNSVDDFMRYHEQYVWTPSFDDTEAYLRAHLKPGDLVITMGCGDVNMLNEQIHRHELEKKQ